MFLKRVASSAPAMAWALALVISACGTTAKERRYDRQRAQVALAQLESSGLVLGEFALADDAVVDGDTIRVDGLESTLRLLAIDTEETFKRDSEWQAFESLGFDEYLRQKRGDSDRPVKAATPMGEEAKEFAKKFFAGATTVRIERDHPKDIRGRYDRYLAYVFVDKDGVWVNYNLEAVRAGMSPYFTKYGYSRRFHDQFVAAEKEARAAQRGIWNPEAQAYPDYDERKTWWDARAEFVRQFEQDAQGRDDFIVLTHWDALMRLDQRQGREVTVLATVGDIRFGDRGPSRALLSRRKFNDLPAVFFDRDVFLASGITRHQGEFVRVTGVVSEYQNQYNKKRTLQILVNLPSQVVGSLPAAAPTSTSAQAQSNL